MHKTTKNYTKQAAPRHWRLTGFCTGFSTPKPVKNRFENKTGTTLYYVMGWPFVRLHKEHGLPCPWGRVKESAFRAGDRGSLPAIPGWVILIICSSVIGFSQWNKRKQMRFKLRRT